MIWFLRDMSRLDRERGAIDGLQARESWLTGAAWRIDTALVLDADIEVGRTNYPVSLRYPAAFPNCPPSDTPGAPQVGGVTTSTVPTVNSASNTGPTTGILHLRVQACSRARIDFWRRNVR